MRVFRGDSRWVLHSVNPRSLCFLEQKPILGTPHGLFQMLLIPPLPFLSRGGELGDQLGEVREGRGGLVVAGCGGGGEGFGWRGREEGVP